VSSRKAEACRQVAAERSRTGECLALPADLSNEEPCRRLAAEVAEREDRAQVLVNNAGATWGRSWRTTRPRPETWDRSWT
jgi:NAD(P)-dependent dehydrogenase (short-subunit alcohol dehydrogenase family)